MCKGLTRQSERIRGNKRKIKDILLERGTGLILCDPITPYFAFNRPASALATYTGTRGRLAELGSIRAIRVIQNKRLRNASVTSTAC